jgi:hypothetical protein
MLTRMVIAARNIEYKKVFKNFGSENADWYAFRLIVSLSIRNEKSSVAYRGNTK